MTAREINDRAAGRLCSVTTMYGKPCRSFAGSGGVCPSHKGHHPYRGRVPHPATIRAREKAAASMGGGGQ